MKRLVSLDWVYTRWSISNPWFHLRFRQSRGNYCAQCSINCTEVSSGCSKKSESYSLCLRCFEVSHIFFSALIVLIFKQPHSFRLCSLRLARQSSIFHTSTSSHLGMWRRYVCLFDEMIFKWKDYLYDVKQKKIRFHHTAFHIQTKSFFFWGLILI